MRARSSWIALAVALLGGAVPTPERGEHASHPHPITAEHRAIYREHDLLRGTERAILDAHFADARALLEAHAREFPGVSPLDVQALRLLADCAEWPTNARVMAATDFYLSHTEARLRRRLRRTCLERARTTTGDRG